MKQKKTKKKKRRKRERKKTSNEKRRSYFSCGKVRLGGQVPRCNGDRHDLYDGRNVL